MANNVPRKPTRGLRLLDAAKILQRIKEAGLAPQGTGISYTRGTNMDDFERKALLAALIGAVIGAFLGLALLRLAGV